VSDETPIFDKIDKPTPIYGSITGDNKTVKPAKPWWQKILNPVFRRWAYGVTAAALVAGATWAGKPEFIPVALPLIMAIFYVDKTGTPNV
jgi:hypothetical protein